LKANENFLKLQDELASTENQILTSRTVLMKAVNHTTRISKHSQIHFAGMFGFKEKPYLKLQLVLKTRRSKI
jgi:LemA protein